MNRKPQFYFDDRSIENLAPSLIGGEGSVNRLATDAKYRKSLDESIQKHNAIMAREAKEYFAAFKRNPDECPQYALALHRWLHNPDNYDDLDKLNGYLNKKVNLNIASGVVRAEHDEAIPESYRIVPKEFYDYLVEIAKNGQTVYQLASDHGYYINEENMLINSSVTDYLVNRMANRKGGYYPTSQEILNISTSLEPQD